MGVCIKPFVCVCVCCTCVCVRILCMCACVHVYVCVSVCVCVGVCSSVRDCVCNVWMSRFVRMSVALYVWGLDA